MHYAYEYAPNSHNKLRIYYKKESIVARCDALLNPFHIDCRLILVASS
jgi:hypothetical protein